MIVMCSWCGNYIGEKEPLEDMSPSGGICEECYKKTIDEIEEDSSETSNEKK